MKLREIRDILNAEVITGEANLEKEIQYAFAADLLSDVLALSRGPGASINHRDRPSPGDLCRQYNRFGGYHLCQRKTAQRGDLTIGDR